MRYSTLKRTYLISDADLCMLVSNFVNMMKRDTMEFAKYGITIADIDSLKVLGDQFEVFPGDVEFQADVSIEVEDKLAKQDELIIGIRNITIRAESKWGANSARYKNLGVVGINKLNEREIFVAARRVHYVATAFLAELASMGLTQQILDDFTILCQQYEDKLNAVKDAQTERDIKTEERIEMGNLLYSITSKYCNIGKQIWDRVNEAKYNDYLIYTGTAGVSLPIAPSKLKYNAETQEVKWSKAGSASSFQLMYKLKDSTENFEEYYSGMANKTLFQPVAGDYLVKVRGRNSKGYGDFCNEIEVRVLGGV